MAIEIERKFLVISEDFKSQSIACFDIKQGFLNRHPNRTVRVRILDDQGFLTIKGESSDSGLSRFEWETAINKKDAEDLLRLCEEGTIEKTRYQVQVGNHIYEVDEFYGNNEGLVLAEIELNSEDESFKKPVWMGKEVTGDIRYYNSQLSKNPFKFW